MDPDQADTRAALMTAMTTEHFVMQTALGATVSEGASRASIYLMSLSSALVAMGFLAETKAFAPFAATVLPVLFMLGAMTVLRMVDIGAESMQARIGIARIRGFYRDLSPEAATHFAADRGRWPEGGTEPAMWAGPVIALMTTGTSMIAAVNAVVAGAGVTLLARHLLQDRTPPALLIGAVVGLGLFGLFYVYQKVRISELGVAGEAATTD